MKNDIDNVVLKPEALEGDAPGADVVTVEVDGRKLRMPRMLMLDILIAAEVRCSDMSDKCAVQGVEDWYGDMVKHVRTTRRFVRSDK